MRLARGVLLALLVMPLGGMLAGCDSMESFQFWDTKKKLPGERRAVFPEGVPGVDQGIPPELMKGYQESQQPAVDPAAQAAQATAEKAQPKRAEAKPKPKPKPKVAKAPPQPQQEEPQPAVQQPQQPQQPPQQTQAWPGAQSWPATR